MIFDDFLSWKKEIFAVLGGGINGLLAVKTLVDRLERVIIISDSLARETSYGNASEMLYEHVEKGLVVRFQSFGQKNQILLQFDVQKIFALLRYVTRNAYEQCFDMFRGNKTSR